MSALSLNVANFVLENFSVYFGRNRFVNFLLFSSKQIIKYTFKMSVLHLKIKILNDARECSISINSNDFVKTLKQIVAEQLYIPINEQKLVYDGKTLVDDQSLEFQNVKDGCRLHLMVKKSPRGARFNDECNLLLRPHFAQPDCKKITECLDYRLAQLATNVSWDDLERYAAWKLQNKS